MRLFTCITLIPICPTGSAVIVLAEDEQIAREILRKKLHTFRKEHRISDDTMHLRKSDKLVEVDLTTPQAVVLYDGDY